VTQEFVLDDVVSVIGSEGEADALHDPGLSVERMVALFAQLLAARRLDEALASLREQGRLPEHRAARGEEAVSVGVAATMDAGDWMFPSGRDAAAVLARGVPLERWLSHALGTLLDPSKARQRPDRFSSREWRVASVNPRGASQLIQAAGVAWAMRNARTAHAAVAFFDERDAEAGEFHDGMNFAGVLRVPLVFVGRSRQWELAHRAFAYGVRPVRVDGGDVLAVVSATRAALDRARRGEGASLLDVRVAPGQDPVARMRVRLTRLGLIDEDLEAEWVAKADAAITQAIDGAARAGTPTRESLFDDVYATAPWHLTEQRTR
jgi:TPP-dependent pyruvate/acetoin dehydrogenase alpha subunit